MAECHPVRHPADCYLCSHIKSGNEAFVKDLSSWTFQESCVLKVNSVVHSKAIGHHDSLDLYRVGDELVGHSASCT